MRFVLLFLFCVTSALWAESCPNILVSIPAYRQIVQEMAGEGVRVQSLIPPGISFHTYEPRPKDIEEAFSSILWFYIGDPFEEKIARALTSHQSTIFRVDLRKGLSLINNSCCHAGADPHIWLDPRMMKVQLSTIGEALKKAFPEKAEDIERRLGVLMGKADALTEQVDRLLRPMKGKIIVVAHGAYAYLCREYGFEQICVEKEGKEPTLGSFTSLIQKAQAFHVKTIFSIKQNPKIGIERVGDILGAKIVELDPYTENYFDNMLSTAEHFYEAMHEESAD